MHRWATPSKPDGVARSLPADEGEFWSWAIFTRFYFVIVALTLWVSGCSSVSALATSITGLTRNYRQINLRAVVGVMVDAHVRGTHFGGAYLRFAALQIAREVREEGARNLNTDLMAGAKNIAGEHTVEIELVNLAGLERFRFQLFIAIAGPEHVETRAHEIQRFAVGRDIEKTDPQIDVGDVRGEIDFRVNGTGDFDVREQRVGVIHQHIVTAGQRAIIVGAVGGVGIGQRVRGIGNELIEAYRFIGSGLV